MAKVGTAKAKTKEGLNMKGNFDRFKEFLTVSKYIFKEEALENGEKFIVMRQPVENGETLGIYCLFNEKQTILDYHIYNIAKISDKSKREKLMELINKTNEAYRFGKILVNDAGEVTCSHSMLLEEEQLNFNVVFEVLVMMVDLVSESDFRKELMRLQWA